MKYSTTVDASVQTMSALRGRAFLANPLSLNRTLMKKNRFLSVACYFGLAPLLWFSGAIYQRNRLVNHHLLYSLAFSSTALFGLLFSLAADAIQYWFIVYIWNPTMAEFNANILPFGVFCLAVTLGSILVVSIWALAWIVSLVGAVRGRMPRIPIISRLVTQFRVIELGVYWTLLVDILVLAMIGLGIRSARITGSMPEKADVYVLYTVGGYVSLPGLYENFTPPRWAVTMAFYPLVQAGLERFGDHGVSILPLSEETFETAIQNGRFIFVASHGGMSPGGFTISGLPYREYLPSDVDQNKVGEQLQYVYFAGCWTGDLESEWRQALRVETGKMFGRLSFVDEHMLWAWFKSPAVIAGLN